jgi:hypothetical protein
MIGYAGLEKAIAAVWDGVRPPVNLSTASETRQHRHNRLVQVALPVGRPWVVMFCGVHSRAASRILKAPGITRAKTNAKNGELVIASPVSDYDTKRRGWLGEPSGRPVSTGR